MIDQHLEVLIILIFLIAFFSQIYLLFIIITMKLVDLIS
jgi:hypothetical protein